VPPARRIVATLPGVPQTADHPVRLFRQRVSGENGAEVLAPAALPEEVPVGPHAEPHRVEQVEIVVLICPSSSKPSPGHCAGTRSRWAGAIVANIFTYAMYSCA
jgi:hypothetical protein